MNAIKYTQYGSPAVLVLTSALKPAPGDDEVLIKIHATTVTPVDCSFRAGNPFIARLYTGLFKPKNAVLGTELAGEVEAVGKDVTRFKEGDQVFASPADGLGAHAQFICMSEDEALAIMPTNMGYDEAATICTGALTALPFLRDKGKLRAGHKVLINGASGSIGTFAVQLAKHFGAEVTGVCSTVNLPLVRSLGADHVVDYTKDDFTKTGESYDIIFDTVGKSSFSRCRRAMTENSVYLSPVATLGTMLQMLWTKPRRQKAIFAATGLRPASEQVKDLQFLRGLIEDGKLKTVIDRSYPLKQIAAAHVYVAKGHKKGNVVVTVEHEDKPLRPSLNNEALGGYWAMQDETNPRRQIQSDTQARPTPS